MNSRRLKMLLRSLKKKGRSGGKRRSGRSRIKRRSPGKRRSRLNDGLNFKKVFAGGLRLGAGINKIIPKPIQEPAGIFNPTTYTYEAPSQTAPSQTALINY
jgi:hypothetical protein